MPALYERPTQLKRHPDGAEGEAIYQKRVPKQRPEWIEMVRVTFPSGRHADELCVTEVAQVAWAANLGTIDFHPWPSAPGRRRASRRAPDRRRPTAGHDLRDGKRVAAVVREILEEIGFRGWPKTSGNRGIHIACGSRPSGRFPWSAAAHCRSPARWSGACRARDHGLVEGGARRPRLHRLQPERPRPHDRFGVLVRARPDATVSAPVTWDELPDVETEDFTIPTMLERFARLSNVQSGIDEAVCDLRVLLAWVERDESAGLGEAPYPPHFPKMPDEPPRVQPSRARTEEDAY